MSEVETPFDTPRTLRDRLTFPMLRVAYRMGFVDATERDGRISELEGTVLRHLETIAARDRVIVALQGESREQDIRLAVLHDSSWAGLADLDERAEWVLRGEVPAKTEQDEKLVDFPVKGEMAEGPRPPEIRRDSLLSAIADLRVAAQKLGELRTDSNVGVGKVRIQSIDDRVKGILLDLEAIVEGRA